MKRCHQRRKTTLKTYTSCSKLINGNPVSPTLSGLERRFLPREDSLDVESETKEMTKGMKKLEQIWSHFKIAPSF